MDNINPLKTYRTICAINQSKFPLLQVPACALRLKRKNITTTLTHTNCIDHCVHFNVGDLIDGHKIELCSWNACVDFLALLHLSVIVECQFEIVFQTGEVFIGDFYLTFGNVVDFVDLKKNGVVNVFIQLLTIINTTAKI